MGALDVVKIQALRVSMRLLKARGATRSSLSVGLVKKLKNEFLCGISWILRQTRADWQSLSLGYS